MNIKLSNLNTIRFLDGSLKPTSTEVIDKLDKLITICVILPNKIMFYPYVTVGIQHQMGQQPWAHGGGSFMHQMQQQYQNQFMQRQQGGPLSESELDNHTDVTIDVSKITFKVSGRNHYCINKDGEWTFTIDKSHYSEPLSYYASLLCNEVIANSK